MKKASTTCLYRHSNGTYYFRRAVPQDLVPEVGKTTWKHSLRTDDLQRAALKAAEYLRDSQAEIDRLRIQRPTVADPVSLDPETFIRERYETRRRRNYIRVRPNILFDSRYSTTELEQRIEAAEKRLALLDKRTIAAPVVVDRLAEECAQVSQELGIIITPDSKLGRQVAVEFWQSLRAADQIFLAHTRNNPDELEKLRPTSQAKRPTLGDVLATYLKEREARWSPKTRAKFDTISKVLNDVIGKARAIEDIDRADLRRVRDILQDLPPNYSKLKSLRGLSLSSAAEAAREMQLPSLGRNTVLDYVHHLSAIFGFAVKEHFIERNPALDLKVSTLASDVERRPFTVDELKKLFEAPVYTGCIDDDRNWRLAGNNRPRRSKFWVPIIALHTGMRLNEACQLRVGDFLEISGVPCVEVSDSGGRRLKTPNAARTIPLHPLLLRHGLVDWVKGLGENSNRELFPEIPASKLGYKSDVFSKWFSRFRASVGVDGRDVAFHSFRHFFEDRLREATVSIEHQERIMGWISPRQSSQYGDGPSIALLARDMERVTFPGLLLNFDPDGLGRSPYTGRRTQASRITL